jgi:hypothetical protein
MCEENKEDNYFTAVPSPYSPTGMQELNFLKSSDIDTDHWAAGMIMLEILVGSKIVLALDNFNDIKWLLSTIHNYVDTQTHYMMKWLMERSINFDPRRYLDETLSIEPNLIKENIIRLE